MLAVSSPYAIPVKEVVPRNANELRSRVLQVTLGPVV